MSMMNIMNGNGTSFFPPCTSNECQVDEKEKQRVSDAAKSKPSCAMTERCVSSCAAYGRVCPCAARIAAHYACDAMQELKKNSRVFAALAPEGTDMENPQGDGAEGKPDFPYLNAEDIVIGEKLGEGGFSNVNLCTVIKGDEAGQQFAIKYLKKRAMVELHQFKHGAADLAVEAFFLQALDHPHIVKLHGVTAGSVENNVASGKECGFFIVVDRLTHTLEELLEQWRIEARDKNNSSISSGLFGVLSAEAKQKRRSEFLERIEIAMQIADAMEYLHSLEIVFRDLKPDNMGFNEDGALLLFDFGLAKELKPGMERADGKYKLTGNTGSRRYMAPEVAKEIPYNKSVDVYSFGILLHELVTGDKPFFGFSSGKHMQQVVLGGERPKMDAHTTGHWPANLKCLMKHCWSPFPALRPSFTDIKVVLQDILDGKEEIHPSIRSRSSGEINNECSAPVEPPAVGFIGSLFHPMSRKKARSRTTGSADDSISGKEVHLPKDGFQQLKPPTKGGGRSRSWGFGHRR